jgi:hypothetical protein
MNNARAGAIKAAGLRDNRTKPARTNIEPMLDSFMVRKN